MNKVRRSLLTGMVLLAAAVVVPDHKAHADTARQINQQVDHALHMLYASQPRARELSRRARAILVFPKIIKAGLVIGAQGGDGALRVGGRTVGYYNIGAASVGLQAGAQTFGYALFFMNDAALKYLRESHGWSIGSGPSVVVVDKGAAASMTSTTLTQDVYAFPFDQRGLMAGIGLEGSKISEIHPSP
jgi:lipid-binding SYLF domain-containing protein